MPAEAPTLYYGGQAIIEGVMMRGRRHAAIAVRRPDGTIAIRQEQLRGMYTGRPREIPLLRGMIVLAETLALGSRALLYSSNVAMDKPDAEKISKGSVAFMLAMSLAFVGVIFFAGPVLATSWLHGVVGVDAVVILLEGLLRLVMLLAYLALIGLMPDVRRVFAYHGAEHMTIHAYEQGRPLRIPEIRPFPTEHTRCGTSFLLVVVVVSILVFTALGAPPLWLRILSRILLIPVIAAISYEIIRLGARYRHHRFVAALFKPNLALQAFTTRKPDDSMIEVAVTAFRAVVEAEGLTLDSDGHVVPAVSAGTATAPP